uniref:Uncharacterized protein n=1 Tax=Anguilla anguilla TaxID=7936 RepID=A0A0E9TER4_ANGAN
MQFSLIMNAHKIDKNKIILEF